MGYLIQEDQFENISYIIHNVFDVLYRKYIDVNDKELTATRSKLNKLANFHELEEEEIKENEVFLAENGVEIQRNNPHETTQ